MFMNISARQSGLFTHPRGEKKELCKNEKNCLNKQFVITEFESSMEIKCALTTVYSITAKTKLTGQAHKLKDILNSNEFVRFFLLFPDKKSAQAAINIQMQ